MTKTRHHSIGLRRLSATCLAIAAIIAFALAAPSSRAGREENQPEQNGLPGTWISVESGSAQIASYMSDGRVISAIPLNILTGNGPGGTSELAAPAQGEWIRTGVRKFTFTSYSLLSSPLVGFTHLVKLTGNLTLNKNSDELTLTDAMVAVFLTDGTPQFPPFPGSIVHFKRVIAGQ